MLNLDSKTPGSAEPILVAEKLSKSYGRRLALRELSFILEAGQILGLLGPNGAGKTTAIRILTTILPPCSGQFFIDGVGMESPEKLRSKIGVLPESFGFPGQWTAMEFVVYFAQLYGYALADAEKKSWRLLEEVGLQNRANSPIGRYSRGMRQRLGIARAFINDPLVVFLDEPTLGLDPRGQKELLLFVRKLAKERNTGVILCSHFLSEIEDFCDEVVILNSGSVVAKGPVDKVIGQVYDQAPRMHQVRVRVSPARIQDAWQRLEGLREVANVATEGERAGWLRVELANSDDAHTEENHPIGNRILETLIRSEIPILDFETGTGRLENALLWLTAARRE